MSLLNTNSSSSLPLRILATVGLLGGTAYALGLAGLYLKQEALLLHPDTSFFPEDTDHPLFTLTIWESNGLYKGLVTEPRNQAPRGTVLFFHGNAGHAAHRMYVVKPLAALGYRVVLWEYPGFGRRAGEATSAFCLQEAQRDFALTRQAWDGPLYLMGESFGAGIAAQLASRFKEETAGVSLITPWDSLTRLVQEKLPFIPAGLLLRTKMDTAVALAGFGRPVVIVAAGLDAMIPPKHAYRLAKALPGSLLIDLPASDHSAWMGHMTSANWQEMMGKLDTSKGGVDDVLHAA